MSPPSKTTSPLLGTSSMETFIRSITIRVGPVGYEMDKDTQMKEKE